ncbi:MAG: hypothetical protein GXP42_03895 [Chloroflexi bacterium]|nr:hypothetical protein [Chloroflexota bacterium]
MNADRGNAARMALFALFFLFFFQLLADFIETVYAFGLLGTGIPSEIAAVLFLFSPALLFLWRDAPGHRSMGVLWIAVLAARLGAPMLDTRGRMLLSGAGVAAWLLLFAMWLAREARRAESGAGMTMGLGLFLSVMISVLLRILGSGLDISTVGWGRVIGAGLVVVAAALWFGPAREPMLARASGQPTATRGRFRIIALCLGLMAALTLFYFVFTAPHVVARWTGVSYAPILAALLATWAIFGWVMTWHANAPSRFRRGLAFWPALAFVLALYLIIRVNQVDFPRSPNAYPLLAPSQTVWRRLPLWAMLVLSPVLFYAFVVLIQALIEARPSPARLALGFTAASFFLLLAIFGHVFTTVYDYIPVVGPLFRDKFGEVHLAVGLVLLWGLAWTRGRFHPFSAPSRFPIGVLALAVFALLGFFLVRAQPSSPTAASDRVTILTYNIQQGYSEQGQRNFDGQLAIIRQIAPDIIALQESDDARVANGNADVVRYFADRLDMYSYYGPKTVTGTFGIALLSRYPILNPRTYFLYSEGEQVAVIQAHVAVGEWTRDVFVTHLGNGGPMIQQQQLLELWEGHVRFIALGDFNFRPDSEQYRLTTSVVNDSWTARWPDWADDRGQKPTDKIDHIFVSPGTTVFDARFIDDPASDHPAVTATIEW